MSINPTLQNSAFLGNQDFTWWLGTVENADDKDAKLGRVKVKILGFHKPDEKPDELPWALVMQPTTNAAISSVGNAPNQLKPGSFVMGFFLDYPDCQQPVVLGTFYSQIKAVVAPETQLSRDLPGAVNIISEENQAPKDSTATSETTPSTTVSDSIAAKSLPASPSNPSGQLGSTSVANGKDGPLQVLAEDIKRCIEGLGNIFKTGEIYQPNKANPTLTHDVSKEQQYIPVSNIKAFPPTGKIKIGSEEIGYNGKNEHSLVLIKRGMSKTAPAAYPKGTKVTFIHKTDAPYEIVGKFTSKVVDLKSAIDMCIQTIRNLVWHIVNFVKSWLMEQVTIALNAIGLSSISPIPYFVKIVTEVLLQVLKTIGCTLDEALVEAIMGGIEGFIEGFIDQMISWLLNKTNEFINFVEQCINDVFGVIFQITSIATQIADAIEGIIDLIDSVGGVAGTSLFDANGFVNPNVLANVGNIVAFILNILGIGCNRTTDPPIQIQWDSCEITQNNCNPLNFTITGGIPGRWNPEYSKITMQSSEVGHVIVMDDTPHSNRLVIEAGGSRTGFHILDNGDIEVTNSNNKTEVTFGKQQVSIKGDAFINVKGNYHLQVGGDYHLEVRGKYSVSTSRESKITYVGEHETIYKNDAKLSAANGFALAASKLGLSASGQCDLYAPTYSTFTTEQNHLCTGSYNRFCMYDNKTIGLNAFKLIGGFKNTFRVGTDVDWGVGPATWFQATGKIDTKAAFSTENIFGIDTKNKLSIDTKNVFGVCAKNTKSINFKDIAGLDLGNFAGAKFNIANGLTCMNSAALNLTKAPFTMHQ